MSIGKHGHFGSKNELELQIAARVRQKEDISKMLRPLSIWSHQRTRSSSTTLDQAIIFYFCSVDRHHIRI